MSIWKVRYILYKAIIERNLYKITQYITIKFTVDYKIFYFNSDISVLKSVKSLQPMINLIMQDFENFIPNQSHHKSGGAFTGIIKVDVKMNKSKQIYGGSYVELQNLSRIKKRVLTLRTC